MTGTLTTDEGLPVVMTTVCTNAGKQGTGFLVMHFGFTRFFLHVKKPKFKSYIIFDWKFFGHLMNNQYFSLQWPK